MSSQRCPLLTGDLGYSGQNKSFNGLSWAPVKQGKERHIAERWLLSWCPVCSCTLLYFVVFALVAQSAGLKWFVLPIKCRPDLSDVIFWFYVVPPMEDCKEQEPVMDNNISLVPFERPAVIEKLTSNMGKRKSSTPQKFVGKLEIRLLLFLAHRYRLLVICNSQKCEGKSSALRTWSWWEGTTMEMFKSQQEILKRTD